jgi:hypothetical protein
MYSTQKKWQINKIQSKERKNSRNLEKKTFVVGWSLLVLLQVLPLAQESGEWGESTKSSKAMKQQWGVGGTWKRRVNNGE